MRPPLSRIEEAISEGSRAMAVKATMRNSKAPLRTFRL
jgi:hypothetical protein